MRYAKGAFRILTDRGFFPDDKTGPRIAAPLRLLKWPQRDHLLFSQTHLAIEKRERERIENKYVKKRIRGR
jgi:hypothetical protein